MAAGIRAVIVNLKGAGCQTVCVNWSFVTSKEVPNDFDACWEEAGVDPTVIDPVLLTFDPGRVTQKAKYLGELFPASAIASGDGFSFLEFFQTDEGNGRRKRDHRHRLGRLEMIKNERQYKITRAQAARFSNALESLRQRPTNDNSLHPLIAKAQEDALRSQLADLQGELREYESLKAGEFQLDLLKVVADLPFILIKARIAQGLSQKELAERIGLKEQQIQRYEATDYSSANLARIKEVASAFGVEIDTQT